ncbi:hypothetical protein ACWEHA_08315 [Amycolatopsis nivea]
MAYLHGIATKVVDDAFPGWVEVQFSEADGTQVTLVESCRCSTPTARSSRRIQRSCASRAG